MRTHAHHCSLKFTANCFSGEVSGILCCSCCGSWGGVACCVVRHAQEGLHSFIKPAPPHPQVLFNMKEMDHSEFFWTDWQSVVETKCTSPTDFFASAAFMSSIKTTLFTVLWKEDVHLSYMGCMIGLLIQKTLFFLSSHDWARADFLGLNRWLTSPLTRFWSCDWKQTDCALKRWLWLGKTTSLWWFFISLF